MNRHSVTLAVAGLLLTLSSPSHAYLDPNIGSMLLQGLLAGFAAAGVALRMYWHRIKAFFSRDSATSLEDTEPQESGDSDNTPQGS